jgi:hypothetical protein
MRRASLSIACLAVAALLLVACAESTVRPEGAARTIVRVVSKQTGFHPDDVRCPSGVEAEVGRRFECRFTGPEGPYVAHMKILEVEGEKVLFDIRTRPRGR